MTQASESEKRGSSRPQSPWHPRHRLRAFLYAFAGLRVLLSEEPHAWIHLAATLGVGVSGMVLGLSAIEWALLVIAIALVWTVEALNAALERLADGACPEHDPMVGKAKDLSASAVLIAAVAAVIIGLLVFVPRIVGILGR